MQVLAGDVAQARLGLSEDDYAGLVAGLTHIVHTAADLRVNAPIAELRKTNLQGTEHVLELAQAAQADHGLARLFPCFDRLRRGRPQRTGAGRRPDRRVRLLVRL